MEADGPREVLAPIEERMDDALDGTIALDGRDALAVYGTMAPGIAVMRLEVARLREPVVDIKPDVTWLRGTSVDINPAVA